MSIISPPTSPAAPPHRAIAFWAIVTLLLTSLHHAYGAVVYDSPFRLHMTLVATPFALILTGLLRHDAQAETPSRARQALILALAIPFPLLMIGLYEGLYNHCARLLAYALHLPPAFLDRAFPPSIYVTPDDWFFEASGVVQFAAAAVGLAHLRRLLRR